MNKNSKKKKEKSVLIESDASDNDDQMNKKGSDRKMIPSDMLGEQDIRQRLINYKVVEDIKELVPGDQIVYFEKLDNGKYRYKPGGFIAINRSPDYLVVTNGRSKWSVQLDSHIILVHYNLDELNTNHQQKIVAYERKLDSLRLSIIQKDRIIRELQNKFAK